MEENRVCGLCGKEVTDENLGNVITYRGQKITLCEDCDTAVSAITMGASPEEESAARNYLQTLIDEKKTSPMGTKFILDSVIEPKTEDKDISEEPKDEIDDSEKKSSFASFLRLLAWITWIGGLIVSISGATIGSFNFATFLTLFTSYLIYGALLMGMATIVDKITDTNNKVNELVKMLKK